MHSSSHGLARNDTNRLKAIAEGADLLLQVFMQTKQPIDSPPLTTNGFC